MKLYVAVREYAHEGFEILGIYDKQDNAMARVELDKESGSSRLIDHDVMYYELNKDEEA